MGSLWEKWFFLFGQVLSYFSCVTAAHWQGKSTVPPCLAVGFVPQLQLESRGEGAWPESLGTKFDSCSPPIPMLSFRFFQKPGEGKVPPLSHWYWWEWNPAGAAWGRTVEQRNSQSPALFSSQSLIADPPGTRRWIYPFVFLSEVSADWFVKWLHAQMRYWDVQFDSYSAPQQCPGEASYSTKKIVVIVGECVHRNHLSEWLFWSLFTVASLSLFSLGRVFWLCPCKKQNLLFNCWPEGPVPTEAILMCAGVNCLFRVFFSLRGHNVYLGHEDVSAYRKGL